MSSRPPHRPGNGETGVLDGLDDLLVGIPGPSITIRCGGPLRPRPRCVLKSNVFDHLFSSASMEPFSSLRSIGGGLILRHRLEPRVRLDAGDAEKRVAESVQRPAKVDRWRRRAALPPGTGRHMPVCRAITVRSKTIPP